MNPRIGFCCKWKSPDGDAIAESLMNQVDSKVTFLDKISQRSKAEVEKILIEKVTHNMDTLQRLVSVVGDMPQERRLVRLGGQNLPCYTHEVANWVYHTPTMRGIMESGFKAIGDIARSKGVRLGFHPDHFVQINTDSPSTLVKSILTLEMHTEQLRLMGFAGGWHKNGAYINVHLGGKKVNGMGNFRENFPKLSKDAQNLITIENDEFSFGLQDVCHIADLCPIVTDIFHNWVNTKGEYLQPDDPLITETIIPSWRGVRPLGHFSTPRQEYLPQHNPAILPNYAALKATGLSARLISAHSEYLWNTAMNDWAISHLSWMDIEVEAKAMNLASEQLYAQFKP